MFAYILQDAVLGVESQLQRRTENNAASRLTRSNCMTSVHILRHARNIQRKPKTVPWFVDTWRKKGIPMAGVNTISCDILKFGYTA